ncbi:hypothetical protein ALI144C_00195 [Actinosynnema sp. ALI-1.44]|nr:hypothetical protein ALI144C_00195 [Actinosynnema sp. ALI-1.44]
MSTRCRLGARWAGGRRPPGSRTADRRRHRAGEGAFAAPGLHEVIDRWQSRHPYKVAWANHAPLS